MKYKDNCLIAVGSKPYRKEIFYLYNKKSMTSCMTVASSIHVAPSSGRVYVVSVEETPTPSTSPSPSSFSSECKVVSLDQALRTITVFAMNQARMVAWREWGIDLEALD